MLSLTLVSVRTDKPVDDMLADGTPYIPARKLEGKAMLITGGDSGIGRATAILAALEGANVWVDYPWRWICAVS